MVAICTSIMYLIEKDLYKSHCLRYKRDCLILERALGRDTHSLLYILTHESTHKYLLRYIDAMKRFQATFGEVS